MATENTVTSQNTSVQQEENKNCCGICLTAYKSPRILPCNHIFCRLCLTKLADEKKNDGSVSLACPLCRKEINLSSCGVDKLPMHFDDEDDDDGDDDDDDDGDDVDTDQKDACDVCENSIPAENVCFQCQKLFCVPCRTFHDKLLKHEMKNLKLDLSQDKCIKHPEVKVRYVCLDCGKILCKACIKSEHSLHQTQTLKSYLMEIDGELKDYSSGIKQKLKAVEMSKVKFSSNREFKVREHINNVTNLGKDYEIELEKACRSENKNHHEDKTLLNRINFTGRKIKKSKKQRQFNQNLISEIKELQDKIATHKTFYLPNNVDNIINNQIGMMDVQIGRLFVFQMKEPYDRNFFFGNLNWTLSINGSSISLTPFRKLENTLLIESITTTVTFYVEDGADGLLGFGRAQDSAVLRKFTKTFESAKDQLKKVLFQDTNIKHRTQVE